MEIISELAFNSISSRDNECETSFKSRSTVIELYVLYSVYFL